MLQNFFPVSQRLIIPNNYLIDLDLRVTRHRLRNLTQITAQIVDRPRNESRLTDP